MRIQHNIMAMNAYRNFNRNTSALSKNLEKLSSGYKINRAGDDAAGLAISEKMRAQITGLTQAQSNAKSGINLIQTAEGAMQEVHDMLNRMVKLADQSANGTYDNDVDRTQLQKEVNQLRSEIDRIADASNFNGIKLLDGSMDGGADITKIGNFDLPALSTGKPGSGTILHQEAGTAVTNGFSIDLHNVSFTNKTGEEMNINIGDNVITIKGDDGGTLDADAIIAKIAGANGTDTNVLFNGDELDAADLTIGGGTFSIKADDNGRMNFVQDPADTKVVSGAMDVSISGVNSDASITGTGAVTGVPETQPALQHTVTYDLTDLAVDVDSKVKISFGGKNYTLDVLATDDEADIAAKLKTAYDADKVTDTAAGAFEMTDNGDGTFTLTATNKAALANTTLFGNISATDGDMVATVTGPASGDKIAVATGDPTTKHAVKFNFDGVAFSNDGIVDVTLGGQTYSVAVTKDMDKAGFAAALKSAYDQAATKISDTTAGAFTMTDNGDGTITMEAAAVGALNDGTLFDTAAAVASSADNVTPPATLTATVDQTGVDSNGKKPSIEFNLDNVDLSAAHDMTVKLGGKEYTVSVTEGMDKAAFGAALIEKINADKVADDDAGAFTASYDEATNTLKLTGENMAELADADLFNKGMVTSGAENKSVTGDYNASTTVINDVSTVAEKRLASTYFDLSKDMIQEGGSITIGKETYVFKTDKGSTITAGDGQKLVDVSDLDASADDYLSKVAKRLSDAAEDNSTYTVGHDGDRITITENDGQTDYTMKVKDEAGNEKTVSSLTTEEAIAKTLGYRGPAAEGKGLTLQIGDTSDEYNQLTVSIKDMHADALGIGDIDISTQEGAAKAVTAIKNAINTVSDVRGTLGATQNRLDHTINNLSVMTENIQDAESTIRDTDVAEEMMAYTKNNILIQSAQAMLAQANQVPQGVLQLLQ